ncbi:putative copper resistance protein D [Nakamurella panacisegetis]|uniref:Putative copper resistance protein D n=1 Tax=Nakamurella panacisegetis TaxID=1090615 RepID=A0A1H0MKK3_9ACTN|nr:putative copper resistance protein D [Nakamurella panacisegetis]
MRFAGLVTSGGLFALLVVAAGLVATIVGSDVTKASSVAGIVAPPWIVTIGIPVFRTLLDLSAVAVTGLGLLSKMVGFDRPERTEAVVGRSRSYAVWASALWAISALVSVVLLSVELDPTRTVTPASIWSYVSNIAAGKGLLMSAGCALLSLWLARVAVRHGEKVPAELRVGIALFGLLPLPLTGHAANWYYHDLSMVSMELHVVAATAWAGGLAALVIFLAREPALLAEALPRFSKLATWCVFVVGVTGVFNGLLELALSPITQLPGSIVTTRYGVILLAKAVCMVIIAIIAVRVRTRILPLVVQKKATSVALWCGWEIVTLAVAFGVAVVLTRASVTPF